ncbi:hypothetical protein WSS_A36163 [Rhodococcus opacus M213]|uniref:Uncharacterized protein n=1 Tax=Rhodococcus opacus M213 TaxID=1129896 RepID=K8X7Y1_RHOOP|nr:hypothetical protein [Rhodococcus opacus]EKT77679.1 hypothetical protein WSS_A36163 [Rhodococcus opacus M213]
MSSRTRGTRSRGHIRPTTAARTTPTTNPARIAPARPTTNHDEPRTAAEDDAGPGGGGIDRGDEEPAEEDEPEGVHETEVHRDDRRHRSP